ncbi:MAG: hypothetical protein KDD51_06045 [Bdellovibrionales bacterium]|nr:hypothetical protein [Bdellovibrionales bacterium]
MSTFSKYMFALVTQSIIQHYEARGIRLAKIHLARAYIIGVRELRSHIQVFIGISVCLLSMGAGFVLLVLGLTALLPIGAVGRASAMTAVGAVALFGPLALFLRLNSERLWVKKARVKEVLETAVGSVPIQQPRLVKAQP